MLRAIAARARATACVLNREHSRCSKKMRPTILNPRLQAIYDICVETGAQTFADIGADHGKLACALAMLDSTRCVIATDISAFSLQKAQKLAIDAGLADKFQFRCGDGLGVLRPGEAQTVIISGMGAENIAGIMASGDCAASDYILQPTREPEPLLSFLYERGFAVLRASITLFCGRYYQTFRAARSPEGRDPLMRANLGERLRFSPRSELDREPMLIPMLEKGARVIAKKLDSHDSEPLRRELADILQTLNRLKRNWDFGADK